MGVENVLACITDIEALAGATTAAVTYSSNIGRFLRFLLIGKERQGTCRVVGVDQCDTSKWPHVCT